MTVTSITDFTSWSELDGAARDVYQTRMWAELDCLMRPGDPVLLSCRLPTGDIRVPTVRRRVGNRNVLFSPYGYPGLVRPDDTPVPVDDLVGALAEQVRSADACALLVRLHPVHDADVPEISRPDAATVIHGPTASIDLRAGVDAAWNAVRSRVRSYVRRSVRDGFVPRMDAWDSDFDGFRRAYDESMDRRDADSAYRLDHAYWSKLRSLAPDHLRLVTVHDPAGEVAAGAVVTVYGRLANYHLGGTRSAYLDHHLLELMLWQAAEAVAGSADLLHLGGGVGTARDGLYQLKRGLGRIEHHYRTLRVVADRTAYHELAGPGPTGVRAARFPALAG